MNHTLYTIDRELFTTWIIGAWLLIGLLYLIWQARGEKFRQVLQEFLPVYLIMAAVIYFLLPSLSVPEVNPADPLGNFIPGGLAIRGYGVFLMLAILLSVGMVTWRCFLIGQRPDAYLNLCFVMIVTGLIGARVFFVIQKWDEFQGKSPLEMLVGVMDMTKGGLVVYGSLIGGLLGGLGYLRWSQLSIRKAFDIIAPAMVLGLAIGRIGCLMNGCCYGLECGERFPLGLSFPVGSPPFMEQLVQGKLFGISGTWKPSDRFPVNVTAVEPGSLGFELGIRPGDAIEIPINFEPQRLEYFKAHDLDVDLTLDVNVEQKGLKQVSSKRLPDESIKIHPTQLYASVSAFALCGFLWFFYPLRKFDGQILGLLLILYPISRFVEEAIRADEKGMFGTEISMGQWVSIITLPIGFAVYYSFSKRRASNG